MIQFLPGDGRDVSAAVLTDGALAGVALTGSTATARLVNRAIASSDGPIIPFIAETGGLNAMIVDSTALPEQVVDDVITSAFRPAGQRCSSLRLLCLQDDIADTVLEMLKGAMDLLLVGDPGDPSTDVGPPIDRAALGRITDYVRALPVGARILHQTPLPPALATRGHNLPPTLIELPHPRQPYPRNLRPGTPAAEQ
jgi:RHH-type proline utilization regulon transcriptional repressor/proline dehydrogenase/delta 1-pyrroline-5-carboxylate dehydrogenase